MAKALIFALQHFFISMNWDTKHHIYPKTSYFHHANHLKHRITMKQSSFFLFTLLLSLAAPLFAQKTPFPNPTAQGDSTQAFTLLLRAQQHLDTANIEAAKTAANEAEQILRSYLDENSPLWTDVYGLQGLSLLRTDRAAAFALWKKVQALPPAFHPLSQANAWYFSGTCHLYRGELEQTVAAYQNALDMYLAQPAPMHTNTGRIYSNLGLIATNQGDFEQAIDYFQKAIAVWTTHHSPLFPGLAHPYNNRGMVYWNQGRYDEAKKDYQAALQLRLRTLPSNHPDIAATLNNLGLISYENGALEEAGRYFIQALHIFQQNKDTLLAATATNNLGMIRQRQFEYADARRYYLQTLSVEEAQKPPPDAAIALTLFNIGVSWRDEGQYEQALEYFQRALQLTPPNHPRNPQIRSSIGRALQGLGKYSEALEAYKQAYTDQVALHGEHHHFLGTLLYNQADIALIEGDFEQAHALNKQAQLKLGYKGDKNFSKVLVLFDLCTILAQESQILNRSQNVKTSLDGARKTLVSAQNALLAYGQFSRINNQPAERQIAKSAAVSTAEIAIAANYSLFQQTKDTAYWYEAFHHVGRTKSMQLLASMQEAKTLRNSAANPALLEQEQQLRTKLARLDIDIQEKLSKTTDPTDAEIVQSTLERTLAFEQHETLLKQIIAAGESRLSIHTIPVKTIQDTILKVGQTLLEYFVGDQNIYVFLIQPKHFEVVEIPRDFPLEQWTDTLTRLGIYAYYPLPEAKRSSELEQNSNKNYTEAAQKLYTKLVFPVKAKLTPEVIIIPDGVIGYIPFEALLPTPPERPGRYASYNYLLNEHRFSYCYSATLLREMLDKKHQSPPTLSVLAMAPFHSNALRPDTDIDFSSQTRSVSDTLRTLGASAAEVGLITKQWNGTPCYGTAASIETFQQLASRYRILHLSTHAFADDRMGDYAYLALGNPNDPKLYEKLYARDLYTYTLNADMVVFSACKTGVGKLRRGEGIISMARAFSHAGAKSIVTTLWDVDDDASKDLLVDFYQQLQQGKTKDAALQQAKIDFLTKNRGDGGAMMHPFFWAGFIAIGDMGAMK